MRGYFVILTNWLVVIGIILVVALVAWDVYVKKELHSNAKEGTKSEIVAETDTPLMALQRGLQQYELRVPGKQKPLQIVEFADKQGHHCVLVFTSEYSTTMSCDHK